MMRFENQNRYKQYIPQESSRPFLPILMVKTDNSQFAIKSTLKRTNSRSAAFSIERVSTRVLSQTPNYAF
jgi:hypothetical protein